MYCILARMDGLSSTGLDETSLCCSSTHNVSCWLANWESATLYRVFLDDHADRMVSTLLQEGRIKAEPCGSADQLLGGAAKDDRRGAVLAAILMNENEFEKRSQEKPPSFWVEFWAFLRHNKKWWMLPIVIVLLLFGLLIFLSGTGVAPFIYPF